MRSAHVLLACCLAIASAACGDPDSRPVADVNNANAVNNTNSQNSSNASNNANAMNAENSTNSANNASDVGLIDAGTDMDENDAGVDMAIGPNPLDGIGEVVTIAETFTFTEGPRWSPTEGALYFTDVRASTIYRATMNGGEVWKYPTNQSNGLAFDAENRLWACEHEGRRLAISTDASTIVQSFDTYAGNKFNSPNDLTMRSDGLVYFTDPPYGLFGRTREIAFNGLFRLNPSTEEIVAEWEGGAETTRPNGVILSPDESVLYMADTMTGIIHAFDVSTDGSLGAPRDFATASGPDGLAMDDDGNLYAATADGVDVWAPDGTHRGTITFPRQPANVTFGGPDRLQLFVTAREGLYRVQMVIPGIY